MVGGTVVGGTVVGGTVVGERVVVGVTDAGAAVVEVSLAATTGVVVTVGGGDVLVAARSGRVTVPWA